MTRRAPMILWLVGFLLAPGLAFAQDMLSGVNLSSPTFTEADMTREEVAALLQSDQRPDLSLRRLNGLDLSGLDFSRVNLRGAYLNKAKLTDAVFDGAILDQVWALDGDWSRASLKGASLFAAQMRGVNLSGADLSNARIAGDLTRSARSTDPRRTNWRHASARRTRMRL